jgi:hypothetical protein
LIIRCVQVHDGYIATDASDKGLDLLFGVLGIGKGFGVSVWLAIPIIEYTVGASEVVTREPESVALAGSPHFVESGSVIYDSLLGELDTLVDLGILDI